MDEYREVLDEYADLQEQLGEFLAEWRDLIRFTRIQAEKEGGKFEAPAWATRQLEEALGRYLNRKDAPMTDATALYVVKAIREYEDKRIAFLAPVHPDGMTYDDRCIGGKVEGVEHIPDAVYERWAEDMTPDYEITSTVREEGVPTNQRIGGTEGITVRLGESQPWSIGDVVEFTAKVVGREADLTEPLRSAPRENETAA